MPVLTLFKPNSLKFCESKSYFNSDTFIQSLTFVF